MRAKLILIVSFFALLGLISALLLSSRPPAPTLQIDPAAADATEFTLISVDPNVSPHQWPIPGAYLGRWPELGRIQIADRARRQAVVEALNDAMTPRTTRIRPFQCFLPRHLLRTKQGQVVTEYLICFQCSAVHEYTNNESSGGSIVIYSGKADVLLNSILTEASIPIAGPCCGE